MCHMCAMLGVYTVQSPSRRISSLPAYGRGVDCKMGGRRQTQYIQYNIERILGFSGVQLTELHFSEKNTLTVVV